MAPTQQSPTPTSQGEIAGVRYLEHMMGGDPADLVQLFRRYRRRARLILPYGHPSGGRYLWYNSVRDDVDALVVRREADRLASSLTALGTARPTVGKPLLTGFSQGGMMTFALAVTHPEALAAAFPISGVLHAPFIRRRRSARPYDRCRSLRSWLFTGAPTWRCRLKVRVTRSPSCGVPATPRSFENTLTTSTISPTGKRPRSWSKSGVPPTACWPLFLERVGGRPGKAMRAPLSAHSASSERGWCSWFTARR